MNWAANIIKYQRALAKSESKEDADVRRIYVEMGGLIKKGYETVEKGEIILGENTPEEEVFTYEGTEQNTDGTVTLKEVKPKKRAVKAKNAK